MYPSDYGYATSGGNIVKRQMCLSSSMYNWSNSDFKSDCASKSWLYSSNNNQWTITASTHQNPSYVFELGSNYAVNSRNTSYPNSVRPVVYLNSNIKFEEDTSSNYGSSTNPYRLVTS